MTRSRKYFHQITKQEEGEKALVEAQDETKLR